jgi:hypothetical protein
VGEALVGDALSLVVSVSVGSGVSVGVGSSDCVGAADSVSGVVSVGAADSVGVSAGGTEVAAWDRVRVGVGDSVVGSLVGASDVGASDVGAWVGSGVSDAGGVEGSTLGLAEGRSVGSEGLGTSLGTVLLGVGSEREPEGSAVGRVTSPSVPQPASAAEPIRRAARIAAARAGTMTSSRRWAIPHRHRVVASAA